MYTFIGGVPTAGKTHLAKDFIDRSKNEILHVSTDTLRDEFKNDQTLSKWVNFFRNIDENKYWKSTTCSQHIANVNLQNRTLWPHLLEKITNLKSKHEHIIFEGVSILPDLARKYLDFNGFFLIPPDVDTVYIRLKAHTRWGKTDDLKRQEAKCFYESGLTNIKVQSKKYGYKVFDNIDEGYNQLAEYYKE